VNQVLLINGCPKSGAHAFAALLDRAGAKRCPGTMLGTTLDQPVHVVGFPSVTLGVLKMLPDNCYMIGHVCAEHADELDGFPVVLVLRDPRDCITSYCRHRKRTDGIDLTVEDALRDYWDGGPFVPLYRGFLGWKGRAAVVYYEDMHPAVVGNGSGIYCRHDAEHNTYTGHASDWTDDWDSSAHRAFRDAGGRELLEEAGYR
jgi:hypothetical protein